MSSDERDREERLEARLLAADNGPAEGIALGVVLGLLVWGTLLALVWW